MADGTYMDTLPTPRDVLRMRLGDTGPDFLLSDAHLDAVIAQQGENQALATLARELERQLAQQPQRMSADGVMVDYGDRLAVWRDLARSAEMQFQQASGGGMWSQVSLAGTMARIDEFAR